MEQDLCQTLQAHMHSTVISINYIFTAINKLRKDTYKIHGQPFEAPFTRAIFICSNAFVTINHVTNLSSTRAKYVVSNFVDSVVPSKANTLARMTWITVGLIPTARSSIFSACPVWSSLPRSRSWSALCPSTSTQAKYGTTQSNRSKTIKHLRSTRQPPDVSINVSRQH